MRDKNKSLIDKSSRSGYNSKWSRISNILITPKNVYNTSLVPYRLPKTNKSININTITMVLLMLTLKLLVFRSFYDHPTFFIVINFGSEEEVVNIKKVRPTLPETIKIKISSVNSGFVTG